MQNPHRIALALEIQLLFKNHTETFAGVQQFLAERQWAAIVDNWPEETLRRASAGQTVYDGVIARVTRSHVALVEAARRFAVPVVNVMCNSPAFDHLPGVFPDYAEAGRLQARHLLARGAQHFAFVRVPGWRSDDIQVAGFREVVEAAGFEVMQFQLHQRWDEVRSIYRTSTQKLWNWMDTWRTPIGVATCTDDIARTVAQMCLERQWRIPQSVALIGSRNEEQLCKHMRPELSSVELGYERVGYEAGRLLAALMEQRDPQPRHVILPPVGVVERESTALIATVDPLVAETVAFISTNCHTPINVEDVAEAMSVSTKTLQSHFARVMDRTVGSEIRRVRLERVKKLLAESDLAIKTIAKRSGFTSAARLCEVFRRDVGMSPSEFREQRGKEPKARR